MAAANPLTKAVKRRDFTALEDAIRSGADLNGVDSMGWTPLFHAAGKGWTNGLRALIQAGAEVNHGIETGFTALYSAVMSGHIGAVQILLDAGAQVQDMQGTTVARHAQGKNRLQVIGLLERATHGEFPDKQ